MTQTVNPPAETVVVPPVTAPVTPPDSKVITMTEAQLAERLARATSKYEDYDTIKTKLAELQKSQESEVERQVREAREAAEARIPELVGAQVTGAHQAMIRAELRSQAVVQGFKYPEDVIDLLARNTGITVDDKFTVTGAEKLVKELAEKRPEWLSRQQFNGAPHRSGPTPPPNSGEETPEMIAFRERHRRASIGISGNTF